MDRSSYRFVIDGRFAARLVKGARIEAGNPLYGAADCAREGPERGRPQDEEAYALTYASCEGARSLDSS